MSNADFFINKGFISLEDNAEFRVIKEAVPCFNINKIPSQRACFVHPMEDNTSIWFPNISESRNSWMNIEKNNGDIIYERNTDNEKHIESFTNNPENKDIKTIRVTFTKGKKGGYIFKGVYKVDTSKSNTKDGLAWVRFKTTAKTYKNII